MKEIADIVQAYEQANKSGKRTALATVVQVEGSAYRREGARMLITEEGQLTGAISGGCLEGDALRKARMVILQQQALLVTYDTMDDDDAKLGVGLGCNGIIHILIEPILPETVNPVMLLKKALQQKDHAVLVTVFSLSDRKSAQPGTCLCLTNTQTVGNLAGLSFSDQVMNQAQEALESGLSSVQQFGLYTAFFELLKPLPSLAIIGAGNDAIPLTQLAAVLGWDITVVDGRPNYALSERFPSAQQVLVAKPDQVLTKLAVHGRTAFVLMTHNYNYELAFLQELLPLKPDYTGILGPKKKLERLLGELEDRGLNLTPEDKDAIHGPVGLDIGSENAAEIALSIVAEVQAVFAKRNGRSLKYKPTLIHSLE